MTEDREVPEDTDVASYAEVQAEVDKHFGGDWAQFLKAVQNPAEVLHFVLVHKCEKKPEAFEAWAKDKGLPPDWVPRFYGTLTSEGDLKKSAGPSED